MRLFFWFSFVPFRFFIFSFAGDLMTETFENEKKMTEKRIEKTEKMETKKQRKNNCIKVFVGLFFPTSKMVVEFFVLVFLSGSERYCFF